MASEGCGDSRMKSKSAKMKMTVEEYLNFVCSDTKPDLTVDHLNQIIDMHGFKRIHKQQKSELSEALNSMELLNLARSTVNVDGVSADAVLSIDDVIKDLNELKWQECCVTSLQALNAKAHHQQQPSPGTKTDSSSALTCVVSAVKSNGKRKYKIQTDNISQDNGALASSGGTDFKDSGTASGLLERLPPKKRGAEQQKKKV